MDTPYYSLADFVMPEDKMRMDYVGAFAVTSGQVIERMIRHYQEIDDNYNALLLQSLSDRLAEAATELLHYRVRKEYWGYVPEENLSMKDLLQEHYQGIRPAVGYPSLPGSVVEFCFERSCRF